MNSRELIKKVIEFDNAERIGYCFNGGYPNDFSWYGIERLSDYDYGWHNPAGFTEQYPGLENFEGFVRKDEFGNLWGKMLKDPSPQGEVLYGVLQSWEDLDGYKFPDLSNPRRFAYIKNKLNHDKFKIGGLPGFPFSIMRYMRKMEYFLEDILLEQKYVLKLNRIVVNELIKIIDNFADAGMDAVIFYEDWGTQDRLLINPQLWREIFKPSYKELCRRIHAKNMYVFMHSCGYIYDILEDLIETGVNVFQFDQPTLMGADRVSSIFYKRASLLSPVNIQTALPTGNKKLIEEEAKTLVNKFFCGGGFIAQDYGDYPTIQVKEEWANLMREAFIKYGG